jgi:hypothetical protein
VIVDLAGASAPDSRPQIIVALARLGATMLTCDLRIIDAGLVPTLE